MTGLTIETEDIDRFGIDIHGPLHLLFDSESDAEDVRELLVHGRFKHPPHSLPWRVGEKVPTNIYGSDDQPVGRAASEWAARTLVMVANGTLCETCTVSVLRELTDVLFAGRAA